MKKGKKLDKSVDKEHDDNKRIEKTKLIKKPKKGIEKLSKKEYEKIENK
jgi:hypothetical protein